MGQSDSKYRIAKPLEAFESTFGAVRLRGLALGHWFPNARASAWFLQSRPKRIRPLKGQRSQAADERLLFWRSAPFGMGVAVCKHRRSSWAFRPLPLRLPKAAGPIFIACNGPP